MKKSMILAAVLATLALAASAHAPTPGCQIGNGSGPPICTGGTEPPPL